MDQAPPAAVEGGDNNANQEQDLDSFAQQPGGDFGSYYGQPGDFGADAAQGGETGSTEAPPPVPEEAPVEGGETDGTPAFTEGTEDYAKAQSTEDFYYTAPPPVPVDTPTPGYFAPDGTYVPPTGFAKEEVKDLADDENNALRVWEREHQQQIQEKDSQEKESIAAREAAAREELDQFYEERKKRIEVTKEQNKVAEQTFIADRDAPIDAKNLWDRVTQLVDVSKADSNTDVARFRSLLVQLKHHPV